MIEFLLSEFGISVIQSTVSRLLKSLNQRYKRTECIHSKRDNELRVYFKAKMCEYKANQLIFVDKLAANKRRKDQKYS